MSSDQQQTPDQEAPRMTEKPEVTKEHKETAKEMAKASDESRPTTTLPGSAGTVVGTAVADWVDDKDKGHVETSGEEGKVEFRETEQFRKQQEE